MSIRTYLNKRTGNARPGTIASLSQHLEAIQVESQYAGQEITQAAVSMESNHEQDMIINSVANDLRSLIKDKETKAGFSFEEYQIDAGVIAGIISADPKTLVQSKLRVPEHRGTLNQAAGIDGPLGRQFSMESYNEADIRSFQKSSVIFNLQASAQTPFAKMFYEPILLDPTEAGLTFPITLTLVFNEYMHSTDGSAVKPGRRNVVRGFVNPKILENKLTALVPVVRDSEKGNNTKYFVDPALVAPRQESLGGGIVVNTAPLKVDEEVNLIGISQTNRALNSGIAGFTTTIAPAIRLRSVYAKFGGEVYEIPTYDLPGSVFAPAQQGDSRRVELTLDTRSAVIKAETLLENGEKPTENADLWDYNIRIGFFLTGYVVLDRGATRIGKSITQLVSVTDQNNKPVSKEVQEKIAAIVDAGEIIGYVLDASSENLDLRQNGLLIESKTHNMMVTVPYRHPISSVTSTYEGQTDTDKSLTDLVALHNMAADGAAVERLFEVADTLRNYTAIPDDQGDFPMLECVGALAGIIPTYYEDQISAASLVDGTRSANRAEDIKAALLEYIHVIAMNLIEKSEYIAVAKALTGNDKFKPTIIVGTDIVLHSYLSGKFGCEFEREEYDIKFEKTVNQDVRGKIFISMSHAAEGNSTTLNPLGFGNYIYSPELVSNLNKSVDGQHSRYLTVTPRYLHVWNLPILAVVTVTDVPELAQKLPRNINLLNAAEVGKEVAEESTEG